MLLASIPVVLASVMLLATLVLLLDQTLAILAGTARAGHLFWVFALSALILSGMGLSSSLRARGMHEVAEPLAALKVVSVEALRANPADWKDTPIVLQGRGVCLDPPPSTQMELAKRLIQQQGTPIPPALQSPPRALASRVKVQGEEEVEGEESDYVRDVDFGVEQDANRFKLGDAASNVQVEPDGYQVVPAGAPDVQQLDSGEYSPVVSRNLLDRETRWVIPCDSQVSLTGIVREAPPFLTLEPLPPALCILTDRPWDSVLKAMREQADRQTVVAWAWLAFALLCSGLTLWFGRASARQT
ncbi:MAG: hypothetical protein VKP62_05165 [Candidatus Sericytochromatia bacterium]|nr:hypothetical protein [Candidatus Sericytochromatia bacterium]